MARPKITYTNKENIIIYPDIAEINKITAANMNQIKSVVNSAVDDLTQVDTNKTDIAQAQNDIDTLEAGLMLANKTYDAFQIGAIISTFNNTAPDARWLPLNGQAISRTTYSELYSKLGVAYGSGDGSTTFNLPNQNYTDADIPVTEIPKYYYYIKAKKLLS